MATIEQVVSILAKEILRPSVDAWLSDDDRVILTEYVEAIENHPKDAETLRRLEPRVHIDRRTSERDAEERKQSD